MFFIFFFFFEEDIEEILRVRNKSVLLEDIPHVELIEKYPGYYDWYALEEDNIRIFRHTEGLSGKVRQREGMTNLEYYDEAYNRLKNSKGRLLNRKDCYRLVRKYYDSSYRDIKYGLYTLIIPKEEETYNIDNFYRNIQNWSRFKWEGIYK